MKAYTDIDWREDNLTFDDSVKPWLASFQWGDSVAYVDTLTDENGECVMLRVDEKYKDSDEYDPHYFLYLNFDPDGNFVNAQLQINLFSPNELSITESIVSLDPKTVKAFISSGIKWLTLAASLRISPKKTFCQPLSLMDFSLFEKLTFDIQTETLLFVS